MITQVTDIEPVTISDIQKLSRNPYPGLRPFTFSESHLFFGQDHITDEVIKKLLSNKFVCILVAGSGENISD